MRRRNDRGAVALELVVIAPAVLLVLGATAVAARVQDAHTVVEAAAYDAARAASISRTAATARSAANAEAQRVLTQGGLRCTSTNVTFNPSLAAAFAIAPGTPSNIRVTVSCVVPLAGLGVPGVPASRTVRATFVSPLDLYRART